MAIHALTIPLIHIQAVNLAAQLTKILAHLSASLYERSAMKGNCTVHEISNVHIIASFGNYSVYSLKIP
jgi:hypothetical protein